MPHRPMMMFCLACALVLACALARSRAGNPPPAQEPNTLTPTEQADGWQLLFDGKTTKGWHSFKKQEVLPTWSVTPDGALALTPDKPHRNPGLVSDREFGNFELSIEWRVEKGSNSGIFYKVLDEGPDLNWTGVEYQVIDNTTHPDAKVGPDRTTAAAYYMYPPLKDVTKPVGEWNQTRILVNGKHVEHWLNGEKVVEYELESPDWQARYERSKFKTHPKYGRSERGHIALQDHGDPVEFRSIKIRELTK